MLAYPCFDRASLLADHPKVSVWFSSLEERTQPYVDQRVRDNQLGCRSTVEFLAVTNTPFPWSRKDKYPAST